jgi:hypothetical protein
MAGYLDEPDKTAEVLRDGWYVTGDMATIDDAGFVRITDRLSRFSQIAGEMVPHLRVEEYLQHLVSPHRTVVVTSLLTRRKASDWSPCTPTRIWRRRNCGNDSVVLSCRASGCRNVTTSASSIPCPRLAPENWTFAPFDKSPSIAPGPLSESR